METPSSTTRRVTRSQALAAMNNNSCNNLPVSRKIEESEKSVPKSRQRKQQDRSALFDISNDSPIVGLAKGSVQTPSSAIVKLRTSRAKSTPGSGEALLRGQVKTLLLKVEEDAEISKLTPDSRQFVHLQGFVNSPMGLLAPTPANTPHIPDLSGSSDVGVVAIAPPVVEQHLISQLVNNIEMDEKSQITRSLLLDFSEKSESCDSSEVTDQGAESKDKTLASPDDEDDASVWSIQVNASTHDEEEAIEDDEEEAIEDDEEEDEYYEEEDGEVVDALCEGMNHMSMNDKFEGKHTRFVYDSDDEFVEGVFKLKGLPTPKGKHLRFQEDEDE